MMLTLCQSQDLNQDDQFVRSALLQWAASLKDLGFDGLRIDTVPEVKPSFWSEFTQAAAMYTVGTNTTGALSYQGANIFFRRGFQW
jgi:alpha-amylase